MRICDTSIMPDTLSASLAQIQLPDPDGPTFGDNAAMEALLAAIK
jgi:hypothetical protein